jgi:hypothetical protein
LKSRYEVCFGTRSPPLGYYYDHDERAGHLSWTERGGASNVGNRGWHRVVVEKRRRESPSVPPLRNSVVIVSHDGRSAELASLQHVHASLRRELFLTAIVAPVSHLLAFV